MIQSYLRLHLAILLAGVTGLFGRLITLRELPLVFFRVVIAAIVLALVMSMQGKLLKISWHDMLKIAGCGILLAIHWVFFYGSIKAANVCIGVVSFAMVGFFTALLEPLINHKYPLWNEIMLSMLTVAGILLIFGFDARYRLGITLGVISSVLIALFAIYSKKVQTSTGHKSSTMLLYELIGGGVILAILTPVYSSLFPNIPIIPVKNDIWLLLVFASVFTVVPFLLQLQALRMISAFTVNISYNLEPVYSIILAMIFFKEANELGISFWIGVFLIVLSVVLQTAKGKIKDVRYKRMYCK